MGAQPPTRTGILVAMAIKEPTYPPVRNTERHSVLLRKKKSVKVKAKANGDKEGQQGSVAELAKDKDPKEKDGQSSQHSSQPEPSQPSVLSQPSTALSQPHKDKEAVDQEKAKDKERSLGTVIRQEKVNKKQKEERLPS